RRGAWQDGPRASAWSQMENLSAERLHGRPPPCSLLLRAGKGGGGGDGGEERPQIGRYGWDARRWHQLAAKKGTSAYPAGGGSKIRLHQPRDTEFDSSATLARNFCCDAQRRSSATAW